MNKINMKRIWTGGALVLLMLASATAGAWGATSVRRNIEVDFRNIQIRVDDKPVVGDAEPFLWVEKGRVFVPARHVAEALGATVGWDAPTNTVQIYTPNYVTTRSEGSQRVWTMPAYKFSLRTPAGFVRQEIQTALLQLGLPSPTGGASVVGVQRADFEPVPMKEKLEAVANGFRVIGTDFAVTGTREEPALRRANMTGRVTVGGQPFRFAIRLVEKAPTDWMLFSLYKETDAATVAPIMDTIFDSFNAE